MTIWVVSSNSERPSIDKSFHLFRFMALRAERRVWARHGGALEWDRLRAKYPRNVATSGQVGHRGERTLSTYIEGEKLAL